MCLARGNIMDLDPLGLLLDALTPAVRVLLSFRIRFGAIVFTLPMSSVVLQLHELVVLSSTKGGFRDCVV